MTTKTFEIRDRMTFIPVIAIKLDPSCERDRYLFGRAGYGTHPSSQAEYVIVARIAGGNGQATCDPYDWSDRTMSVAHEHIRRHFDELDSGAVVDVEFILGEKEKPCSSEASELP